MKLYTVIVNHLRMFMKEADLGPTYIKRDHYLCTVGVCCVIWLTVLVFSWFSSANTILKLYL